MSSARAHPAILVVDDDEVLLAVLARVLTRAGYDVHTAANATEALRLPTDLPQLALLDLSLPDGNGVELARALHARRPTLPLILMTAFPNRIHEQPQVGGEFVGVLTKPMNLDELRRIIAASLPEETMPQPTASPSHAARVEVASPAPLPPAPVPVVQRAQVAPHAASPLLKHLRSAGVVALLAGMLSFFLFFVLGVRVPGLSASPDPSGDKPQPPAARLAGVQLVKGDLHTLQVPEEVRVALGIRKGGRDLVVQAKVPTDTRPLTLFGSTALDPTRLVRIRARFPAEVVQIGQHSLLPGEMGNTSGQTETRELRPGDHVKKGDVLGVFFSVDVGSRKNDLLDALVQLELDQKVLDEAEKHITALPEVFVLTQRRAVQGDRNAINRALNNLKVWNIPQEDIDALHEEAKKIAADKDAWYKTPEGRWAKGEKQSTGGKVDPDSENDNPWGRVTLRAPFEGVIVERNVTLHETVVDNTVNLFQIANVKRLLVIANAPEDDLPTLNGLKPHDRRWTVQTVGAKGVAGLSGPIEEIGYLIDPNQHTAIIKGYIDNPDEQIRAGQYVRATVRIPPPDEVVEVPIDAVVEDGKYAVVFVETDAAKHYYTMRRVQVTHRFEKTVFVRSKPFTAAEQLTAEEKELGMLPRQPLLPTDRILKTGVGELKAALLDLESSTSRSTKDVERGPGAP
jgi:cobalt-zinc-cadmium efflux system membrane fusion protein